MALLLTSSAFEEGGHIPVWYTRSAINASPPMGWAGVPEAAESLAILSTSRLRGGRVYYHWLACNIPPEVRCLNGKLPRKRELHKGIIQCRNSSGGYGYNGPSGADECRVRFMLFALDAMLPEGRADEPEESLRAMSDHILEEASLVAYTGIREHRMGNHPRGFDKEGSG